MKQLKILADGDSWNDYPLVMLTHGGLSDHLSNLLGLPILNLASAGDSSEETMGLIRSQRLENALPGTDLLLWSSGGDDIAGDWFKVALNEKVDDDITQAINWPRLNAKFALMIADYEDLLEIRDRIVPKCLLVTHSYDYPPASVMGSPAKLFGVPVLGSWLQPGYAYCGWTDPIDQAAITKIFLTAWNAQLVALNAKYPARWQHVNTQGTCLPEDWQNELHDKDSGWIKLAKTINAQLLPWLDKIANGTI